MKGNGLPSFGKGKSVVLAFPPALKPRDDLDGFSTRRPPAEYRLRQEPMPKEWMAAARADRARKAVEHG